MTKDSFIFYKSWAGILKRVPDDVRLSVYDAVIDYATEGTTPCLDPVADMAFQFIKTTIDRDDDKWNEMKKARSEAGKKGMANRWNNKAKQVITNVTPITVNVNDNVNVDVSNNMLDNKSHIRTREDEKKDFVELMNSQSWQEQVCMNMGMRGHELPTRSIITYLQMFQSDQEAKDFLHPDIREIKSHFINWLNIQLKPKNNGTTDRHNRNLAAERNAAVRQQVLDAISDPGTESRADETLLAM